MTATTASTEPGTIIIRFENQRGALVTVSEAPPLPSHDPDATAHYSASCTGCLDWLHSNFTNRDTLAQVRTWANTHAAECRALPQPEPQD